jgi:threonine dehydrogenase-like Zn-dependent dehydrogenase
MLSIRSDHVANYRTRHEVVGIVTEVGPRVSKFKVGEHVGVGCMVMSCGGCDACDQHVEQYCDRASWTYNSLLDGEPTYGGYSDVMVADEKYVSNPILHSSPAIDRNLRNNITKNAMIAISATTLQRMR